MENVEKLVVFGIYWIGAGVCISGGLWIAAVAWLAALEKLTTLLKVKRAIIAFYVDKHCSRDKGAG